MICVRTVSWFYLFPPRAVTHILPSFFRLYPTDVSETTTCPLLIHFSLPPIPSPSLASEIQAYHAELSNPTGLLTSMKRPPGYSQLPPGLGGVVVADGCGWALGIEGGEGLGVDDFWRREVDCAFSFCFPPLCYFVTPGIKVDFFFL